jgi:hypothetical protein
MGWGELDMVVQLGVRIAAVGPEVDLDKLDHYVEVVLDRAAHYTESDQLAGSIEVEVDIQDVHIVYFVVEHYRVVVEECTDIGELAVHMVEQEDRKNTAVEELGLVFDTLEVVELRVDVADMDLVLELE